jgi:hypothetical protein
VRVVDKDGNTSPWVTANRSPAVQTDVVPPGAPTGFTATRTSNNAVLAMTVPSDTGSGIAGYFIYRDADALPFARWAPGGAAGAAVQYTDPIGYTVPHTYFLVAFDAVGLTSTPTVTQSVDTATPPVFSLTVAVNKPSPGVTVNVVYNDSLPDPTDCGTKTATNGGGSQTWPGLAYGNYTVTCTYGGSTIQQDILLTSDYTLTATFP